MKTASVLDPILFVPKVLTIGLLGSFLWSSSMVWANEPEELVLEVSGKRRFSHALHSASLSELGREELLQLPQGTEVSLPKLLSNTTPGVVLGPFGQLFFRGNHANIQYQLDGIQMPDSPSNAFGQVISPRNIDRMEIITGGVPAEFGQRLAAVLNITTRSGVEKLSGELEMNYGSYGTLSPHLLVGGSSASGKVHYFISANYSESNRGLDTPQPISEMDQTKGSSESIHNQTRGNSEFAKIDWQIDNENKISFISSHSQTQYQIPNYPSSFSYTDSFFQAGFVDSFGNTRDEMPTYYYLPAITDNQQLETNFYAQTIWKHSFSPVSFIQVAPYYKYALIRVKNDPLNDLSSEQFLGPNHPMNSLGATQAGRTPIDFSNPSSFAQNRHTNSLGIKVDYTSRISDEHLLKAGIQLQAARADGVISIQTDLGTSPLIDSDPNTGYYEGIYVQDEFHIRPDLVLNAGLRFDATQFRFAGLMPTESMLQPRLGLTYFASKDTQSHVFYGRLFQPAPVESLRYQYNGTSGAFIPLQSYDIRAEKDHYVEWGIAHSFWNQQILSLNLYYKSGIDVLDDAQLLNTSIAQPYNFATGYAYGAEISLRGDLFDDWSNFINYSYQIAKGQGISGGIWTGVSPSSAYQMMDHVQVHTVNGGITYSKEHLWWTLLGLYGSGLRTGPDNQLNLPSHFTMDTTLGYRWKDMKASLDVLNLFDNRYPVTIANGFNGSHYAAGRQYFVRVSREF